MRSSFIATLFVGTLASPALNRAEQKVLGEQQQQQQQQQQQPSFCNEAKALIAQDSQAATAYCSAYLDLPVITVQKTISRVTKTFTKITSTKTYLDYPVTTKVAKTITHSSTVFGRATTTITTTTSTETYTNPLSTCPVARQNDCSSKLNDKNNNKNSLRSSRPACLSKYISPPQISQACSCLSLPLSSTTTTFHQLPTGHPTGQGETAVLLPLPTQTITLLTAAKLTRTLTRTLTTGTVTLTPTHDKFSSSTKTVYAAATETLILDGPFRLSSAKDYDFLSSSSRKRNGVEWVHVNSTAMREGPKDGKAIWKADDEDEEEGCSSTTTTPPTWFALNGQTLVTQNFAHENQFPRYELLGNVKIVPGEGVAGVYFSLPDSSSSSSRSNDKEKKNGREFGVEGVEGKRVSLRCSFGRKKSWNHYYEEEEEEEAKMNLHEACPLTCRYVGGAGSRNSKREGGQWFVGYGGGDGKDGEEEEEYESFTMYAYRYGGLGS